MGVGFGYVIIDKNTSIYFLEKVHAKIIHPKIMNNPPNGVIKAIAGGKSMLNNFKKVNRYKEPEKQIIPAEKNLPTYNKIPC